MTATTPSVYARLGAAEIENFREISRYPKTGGKKCMFDFKSCQKWLHERNLSFRLEFGKLEEIFNISKVAGRLTRPTVGP